MDLKFVYHTMQAEFNETAQRVMASGQYILGPEVEAFEKEFGKFKTLEEEQ